MSHIEKEQELFEKDIKVLSLFFIDEVAKYRRYNPDGKGEYAEIFEQEYTDIIKHLDLSLFNQPEYIDYLRSTVASKAHEGYFSKDKKGKLIDSKTERGTKESADEDAYDLIMKNKERLLDRKEPIRFIFSHSALREGWDNPNVFQICTLKQSSAEVRKRQEVGTRAAPLCKRTGRSHGRQRFRRRSASCQPTDRDSQRIVRIVCQRLTDRNGGSHS